MLLEGGCSAVIRKFRHRLRIAANLYDLIPKAPHPAAVDFHMQFKLWLHKNSLKAADLDRMRAALASFHYLPTISILLPVYNSEVRWLDQAIQSVRTQVYPHWEICAVNDASSDSSVANLLYACAASDSRIRIRQLTTHRGIAGASAAALEMATGDFVGLLDHDDELSPDALWKITHRLNQTPELDLLYSDEDKLTLEGDRNEPFFKPDWSPELLLSMNYIGHFAVFRRSILAAINGFRAGYDGAQDHDLLLRFTEVTTRVGHIPQILYHWRAVPTSSASLTTAKEYASESGRRAIQDAIQRRGKRATVESVSFCRYRVRYEIQDCPLVTIIIPTKDQCQLLRQAIISVERKTSYSSYEVIVVDNNSTDPKMLDYLDHLAKRYTVLRYAKPFNFSAINNFAVTHAAGEYIVFLNDDVEVITADWLTAMLEQAQDREIGAVGAKLLYPDGRIQHAGVVIGIFGEAGHAFRNLPDRHTSYFGMADFVRNCSAVTAACMMVSRKVFDQVGGFDEQLAVVYNDVDLCLKIRELGYRIVYTPYALLRHYESASRGRLRPLAEEDLFSRRWSEHIRSGDPYYNINLTLNQENWSLRI